MAVIAPRIRCRLICLLAGGWLWFGCALGSKADQASDFRGQLSQVAQALTDGNATDAMAPFSNSFTEYAKLRGYFSGLTNAFTIVNEIDVTDEEDSPLRTIAVIHWSITLTSTDTSESHQRNADIHVSCVKEKGKWRIIEFSPIDLFDPSQVLPSSRNKTR